MKKMFPYLLFFSIGCATISCSPEKTLPPDVLQELESVERAMFDATSNGDSAAFRRLCGVDYFTINANGQGQTLAETLPYLPRFKGSTSQLSEQQQRVFGNFVVRNGRLKAFIGGQQVAEVLYTTGWIYRDGRWQYVHWQGTMTGMMLEPLAGKVMIEPPSAN
jgi:hypothetical protein